MYTQKRPFKDKGNKFNAKKQTYNNYKYDSKKEAAYAMELDWLIKGKKVERYERQVKIDLRVNGLHICNYYCDFKVWLKDGTIQFHEVKGFPTDTFRLKWKLFEALIEEIEPGAELIIIK